MYGYASKALIIQHTIVLNDKYISDKYPCEILFYKLEVF